MGPFAFLNALFLAGLAAAALPILIHLFARRPARDVVFPSLEYLREIASKRVRRVRIKQWLLLALRVAIIALFAIAMGRPVLQGNASSLTRGSSTVAIILDNSYSLGASLPMDNPQQGEAGSLFDAAKQRAEEVLGLMTDEDRGLLVLAGRPVSSPFQTPVTSLGLLSQEISRAEIVPGRADLGAAIAQVAPVLGQARTMNKEIFVISDFQQQDLEDWAKGVTPRGTLASRLGLIGEAYADSGAAALVLPEGVRLYLVPVRTTAIDNVSIERVRFDPAGSGGRGRVVATVVNHGVEPVRDRLARLIPEVAPDAVFSVVPGGRTDVEFVLAQLPADGAVEVRLGSDLLEYDNRAWVVTGEASTPRVWVVSDGGVGGAVSGGAGSGGVVSVSGGAVSGAEFIATALDPLGGGEFFQVRTVGPDALSDPAGIDAQVVVLLDVPRLSDQAVESLGRFRARGGGILIALGERTDPRYYNTQVLSKLTSIELRNVVRDEGAGTYRTLRPIIASHPAFAGFGLGPGEELGSARYRQIIEAHAGADARVLAEFSGNLPALVEENGVALFTSSLDGSWNDFPTSASFLPFVHQLVRSLATRAGADRASLVVGTILEASLPQGAVNPPVTCVDPLDGRTAVQTTPIDALTRLRSPATTQPGLHRFVDNDGRTVAAFAVNLDPAEGELSLASSDLRTRVFGRGAQQIAAGETITRDLLEGRYGRELWRWILALVLILLAAESLLARGRALA